MRRIREFHIKTYTDIDTALNDLKTLRSVWWLNAGDVLGGQGGIKINN